MEVPSRYQELAAERHPDHNPADLSLRSRLGQITEEEYEEQEMILLDQLDAIRAYQEGLLDPDRYANFSEERDHR